MKTILCCLASLFVCAASFATGPATVYFPLTNFSGAPFNRPIHLRLRTQGSGAIENPQIGVPRVLQPTNGLATNSLFQATYLVDIDGIAKTYVMPVPDGTNTYNAWDLINSGTSMDEPFPGIAAGSNIAITTNYLGGFPVLTISSTASGGGSATNAYQSGVGSSRITITTNLVNFTYVFDVPSNAFDAPGAAAAIGATRPLYSQSASNVAGGNYITATRSVAANGALNFTVDMTDTQFKNAYSANVTDVAAQSDFQAFTNSLASSAFGNASGLSSGTVGSARLGTGTASSSTFLRGDGQWATPSGSGNVTGSGTTAVGEVSTFNGTSATGIQGGAVLLANVTTNTGNLSGVLKGNGARGVTAATAGTDYVAPSTTVTTAGTANQISSSTASAQALSGNVATTLSLPSTLIAPGSVSATTFFGLDQWQTITNPSDHTLIWSNTTTAKWMAFGTNGVLSVNGSPFLGATGLGAGQIPYTDSSTNILGSTNTTEFQTPIAPASNATNYNLDFNGPHTVFLHSANTNANFTFLNISTNRSLDVYVNALTSTVPCIVTWPAHVVIGDNAASSVTNTRALFYHVQAVNGVDPTNAVVTGGDTYHRS